MIALVRIALRRPYTFVVLALVDSDRRSARGAAHAGRHLSRHPHPGDRDHLELHRPAAGSDGRPHRHAVRSAALTTTVNDIEHIEATSYNGLGIIKVFFQPERRHPHRQCAGHRGDRRRMLKQMPPGHDAAADPELQRLDRADHPARAVGLGPVRAALADTRPQRRAHAARHRAGRRHSVSLWRQDAAGADRSRLRRRCRRAACPARTSPTRSRRRT